MKAVRRVVAVTLVATALCADRTFASTVCRPQTDSEPAKTLVGRLSITFRRVVPAVKLVEARREMAAPADLTPALADQLLPHHQPILPFQFRLPPPALLAA